MYWRVMKEYAKLYKPPAEIWDDLRFEINSGDIAAVPVVWATLKKKTVLWRFSLKK